FASAFASENSKVSPPSAAGAVKTGAASPGFSSACAVDGATIEASAAPTAATREDSVLGFIERSPVAVCGSLPAVFLPLSFYGKPAMREGLRIRARGGDIVGRGMPEQSHGIDRIRSAQVEPCPAVQGPDRREVDRPSRRRAATRVARLSRRRL